MSAQTQIQVVTANRLLDGAVVYLTAGGEWSELLADSALWRDKDSADIALKASEIAVDARIVVGPYLFDVVETTAGIAATSARERIRAEHKPTIEPEVGSWTGRISA